MNSLPTTWWTAVLISSLLLLKGPSLVQAWPTDFLGSLGAFFSGAAKSSTLGDRQQDNGISHGIFGVHLGVPDAAAVVGRLFTLKLGEQAFTGPVCRNQVREVDSSSLPTWLYFNHTTHTLLGVPSALDQGVVFLEVTAQGEQAEGANGTAPTATTTFLIQVYATNHITSLRSHGLPTANEIQLGEPNLVTSMEQDCDISAIITTSTIILDATLSMMSPKQRVETLHKMAKFLHKDVRRLTLKAKRSETIAKLLNSNILVAGPGNADLNTPNAGVDLSWVTSCGQFRQSRDASRVMKHNIQGGRITDELGYNIIGWHLSETLPAGGAKNRRRRQANAFQTAVPTPTVYSSLPSRLTQVTTSMETMALSDTSVISMVSSMSIEPTRSNYVPESTISGAPSLSQYISTVSSDIVISSSSTTRIRPTISPSSVVFETDVHASVTATPSLTFTSFVQTVELTTSHVATSVKLSMDTSMASVTSSASSVYASSEIEFVPTESVLTTSPVMSTKLFSSEMILTTQVTPTESVLTTAQVTPTESVLTTAQVTPTESVLTTAPVTPTEVMPTESVLTTAQVTPTELLTTSEIIPTESLLTTSERMPTESIAVMPTKSLLTSIRPTASVESPSLSYTTSLLSSSDLGTDASMESSLLTTTASMLSESPSLTPVYTLASSMLTMTSSVPVTSQSVTSSMAVTSQMVTEAVTTGVTTEHEDISTDATTEELTTEVTMVTTESLSTAETTTDELDEEVTTGVTTEEVTTGFTTQEATTGLPTEEVTTGITTEGVTTGFTTEGVTTGFSTEEVTTGFTTEEVTTGFTTEEVTTGFTTEGVTTGFTTDITTLVTTETDLTTTESVGTTTFETTTAEVVVDTTTGATTTKPDVTTTDGELTTTTPDAPNQPPILLNPIDEIVSHLGTYFELLVPRGTFYDREDGATRNLELSLYDINVTVLLPESWVQFTQEEQIIYGIPMVVDVTAEPAEFVLVGKDSDAAQVINLIQMPVETELVEGISHKFTMELDADYAEFTKTDTLVGLLRKLAAFYGDTLPGMITVTGLYQGSVILEWTNNTLSKTFCQNDTILLLFSRMLTDGAVSFRFRQAMLPEFSVSAVSYELLGVCSREVETTTVSDNTTEVVVAAGSDYNIWVITVIPAVVIILLLIIAAIVCCCWTKTKKRQSGRYLLDDEKPVFSKNRKPILLPSELPYDDGTSRPKKPVVMETEPYTYMNKGYQPPEEGARALPPPYNVPPDSYGPLFDPPNTVTPPPDYYSGQGSPYGQPPPTYRLPPPYLAFPGGSEI